MKKCLQDRDWSLDYFIYVQASCSLEYPPMREVKDIISLFFGHIGLNLKLSMFVIYTIAGALR